MYCQFFFFNIFGILWHLMILSLGGKTWHCFARMCNGGRCCFSSSSSSCFFFFAFAFDVQYTFLSIFRCIAIVPISSPWIETVDGVHLEFDEDE